MARANTQHTQGAPYRQGWRLAALPLAFVLLAAFGCKEKPDPYAGMRPDERLAHEAIAALGGWDNYQAAAIIKFDVIETRGGIEVSRRHHDYDKTKGVYTIKWAPPNEESLTVTFNEKQGPDSAAATWSSGIALHVHNDPVRFNQVVAQAWEYYLHDLYMVLGPYRLLDDKAQLTYYGLEKDPDGRVRQKLSLRQTRPNRSDIQDYVFYIDPETKLIQSSVEFRDTGPEFYRWQKWAYSGPLRVSLARKQLNGDATYQIARLRVDQSLYGRDN